MPTPLYLFRIPAALPPVGKPVRDHFVPIFTVSEVGEETLAAGPALRLLRLLEAQGAQALAALLEEVTLYRINLEMLLDAALLARAGDARLAGALGAAYTPGALPETLPRPPGPAHGQLRHPMLAHMDALALAKFYTGLIARLVEREETDGRLLITYGFERVPHKNTARFLEHFDGYTQGPTGAAAAAPLLRTAQRPPGPAEVLPTDPLDRYLDLTLRQYHRARTVDRVLPLGLGTPDWVLADVQTLLAWEEEKRTAAQALRETGIRRGAWDALAAAIERDGAGGYASPALARLVSETLGAGGARAPYSGSAAAFAHELAALAAGRG